MKKNNIFKHELNESIQANAALNCLKNRNTPKKLNESADFDTRFHHRSDLKKLANPVTKKAYMLLYNEFGDNMWRQLGIDDADEQTLIGLLNDMQHYSNNPRDIADFMLGRKSIRNFKQEQEELTAEQEEDTTPPWVGRKYNGGIDFDADGNLQVITPDEDDDDDGEVPPLFDSEQERHDIALACSYCLGESFIVNDGDLDDIYYAVLKVFDSTYDAPATDDYKEVLQWCRKYYKQIENLITTEEQEEQIFKVRTKQGFVEVPLSSEVVDAFHDNLDPRYEDMDTQAALKGINGGARLAALIAGMMEQGYKPTPNENHILELHYNAKKAVKQSQADSSNRNINAYSD